MEIENLLLARLFPPEPGGGRRPAAEDALAARLGAEFDGAFRTVGGTYIWRYEGLARGAGA